MAMSAANKGQCPKELPKSFVTAGCLSVKLLDNCMYCPHYSIYVIEAISIDMFA